MYGYEYDLVVIGAGAGGITAATTARGMGKRVAMIEKRKIGGDCTLHGCVPSKALIRTAHLAHDLGRLEEFGLKPDVPVRLKTDRVMAHVRAVIDEIYQGETPERFAERGIDVIFGEPCFTDSHTIQVGDRSITAGKVILATGSHAFVPDISGLLDVPYLTNENVFELNELPKSMIVLGGGPIGIELSQAFNRLGVKMTVIESGDTILSKDDPELAKQLMDYLAGEGVHFEMNGRAEAFKKTSDGLTVTVKCHDGQTRELSAERALIAVGRRPNVEGLCLEAAGVKYSPKGVTTDLYLRTTAPNIFACGDVTGPYMFSHMAEYQAVKAVTNALLPVHKKANYDHVAWCTFTDPELAHAGLTEQEAHETYGDDIRIYRYQYDSIDRAKTDGNRKGFSKIICDRRGKIVGAHILGASAGDFIHEAQLVKTLGVPLAKIQSAIHIYPTYGDIVRVPSRKAMVDRILNNPVVRTIRKVFGK